MEKDRDARSPVYCTLSEVVGGWGVGGSGVGSGGGGVGWGGGVGGHIFFFPLEQGWGIYPIPR